jgi:L-iditol 2-dehydrogenase
MKAAVYLGRGEMEIKDIDIPKIDGDEVLLRVRLVGLCKTDVKKVVYNMFKAPRVFGHEIVGEIEQAGRNVSKFKKGDRVVVFHHVPCMSCFFCMHGNYSQCETYRKVDTTAGYGEPSGGGFAEFVRVPKLVVERGLIKIPEDVSYEEAVFTEPLNCCLKAVKKAELSPKDTVLIIGQGSIGLTLTQLCKMFGSKIITTDLLDFKLDLSKKFGADFSVHTNDSRFLDKIRECNDGNLPNRCLVAVESVDAIKQGLSAIAGGGKIVFVFDKINAKEILIDPNLISNKEIDLVGSYSSDYSLHRESAELIFKHKINTRDMITHTFGLGEIGKAIDMAMHAKNSIKILITVV